jgi:hypothetical protein
LLLLRLLLLEEEVQLQVLKWTDTGLLTQTCATVDVVVDLLRALPLPLGGILYIIIFLSLLPFVPGRRKRSDDDDACRGRVFVDERKNPQRRKTTRRVQKKVVRNVLDSKESPENLLLSIWLLAFY